MPDASVCRVELKLSDATNDGGRCPEAEGAPNALDGSVSTKSTALRSDAGDGHDPWKALPHMA